MALIDATYSEACACIEQGLCFDEVGDTENAMAFYERSLNLMKEAEKQKNHKKSSIYKAIVEGRKKVEERLKDLKREKEGGKADESSVTADKEKDELKKQIEPLHTTEAELIFFTADGVQLFMIEGEQTTIPTCPAPLEIFRFGTNGSKSDNIEAEAFIQVGPWTYPLLPGKTPVLKNEFGAYVVPNPTQDNPEMCVGILLPKELSEKEIEEFENVLKRFTEMRAKPLTRSLSAEERAHISRKLGDLIVKGGDFLAENINYVAEKTSKIVTQHSSKIRSSLTPDEQPMTINPAIRYGVHYVHKGSKMVAKCTRYLLDKIGDMGIAIGQKLAASAEKHVGSGQGGLVDGTIYVVGSGIASASTVWMALENASKTMARNIADETVNTVEHKWGEQASVTAHKALYATGHTSLAALQLWDLGPRSIAGRAARKAGMGFVSDLRQKQSSMSTLVDKTS